MEVICFKKKKERKRQKANELINNRRGILAYRKGIEGVNEHLQRPSFVTAEGQATGQSPRES